MDLYHAARAVQAEPLQEREAACQELMWQAHVADKHLKRLKKPIHFGVMGVCAALHC